MTEKRRGQGLADAERCLAMGMRSGTRCIFRRVNQKLCQKHIDSGSVIPDGWTQPDNIPIFYVKKATR